MGLENICNISICSMYAFVEKLVQLFHFGPSARLESGRGVNTFMNILIVLESKSLSSVVVDVDKLVAGALPVDPKKLK